MNEGEKLVVERRCGDCCGRWVVKLVGELKEFENRLFCEW